MRENAPEVQVNFDLLGNALNQAGPWKDKNRAVTPSWFLKVLSAKVDGIDWDAAKKDVARFLKLREQQTLELWGKDFFHSRIDKLAGSLV